MGQRHRVKISATLDPELVASVDAYVREHPESNRGKVLDEAPMLWLAQEQARAMIEQYAALDDISEEELRQWHAVLAANAQLMARRHPDER